MLGLSPGSLVGPLWIHILERRFVQWHLHPKRFEPQGLQHLAALFSPRVDCIGKMRCHAEKHVDTQDEPPF